MKRSDESEQEIPEGKRGGQGQSPGASVTLLVLITAAHPPGEPGRGHAPPHTPHASRTRHSGEKRRQVAQATQRQCWDHAGGWHPARLPRWLWTHKEPDTCS